MDLPHIEEYLRPTQWEQVKDWKPGWAWLAGGTWIFSEPQPDLKGLVGMERFDWSEIEAVPEGLVIGATCSLSKLLNFSWSKEWSAMRGLQDAVTGLAASLKVINLATVGGNLCLALSVGTLAPVMLVLNATYEIWSPTVPPRHVAAVDFQTGAQQTVLQPGEVLRRVQIPYASLRWRVNYQRIGIAATDPALAIAVAAYNPQTPQVRFGLNAALAAPRLLEFSHVPTAAELTESLLGLPWLEDGRASAQYRQQMTAVLMRRSLEAVRGEG